MEGKATNKKYGIFDLPERELSWDEVLCLKPRTIIDMLCTKYGYDFNVINKKSFYSWLSRLRKKHRSKGIVSKQSMPQHGRTGNEFGQGDREAISDFKPTDPLGAGMSKRAKPLVLKKAGIPRIKWCKQPVSTFIQN